VYLSEKKEIQYFGPLRFYPKRKDLIQVGKINTEKKRENFNLDKILSPDLKSLQDRIRFLFYKKPLMYLNPLIWINIYSSNEFNDIVNIFLPESMKRTLPGATTSRKMWSELIFSDSLQEKLNKWLSDSSKLKTTYKIKSIEHNGIALKMDNYINRSFNLGEEIEKELVFIDERTHTKVTPRDMGLGVSQVLPIVLSAMGSKNTNIYLEQPELHLHPAIQSELADEIIKSCKSNGNEFVIETHSEHLLLRIMKRMRQTADGELEDDSELSLTPNDVCVLYVNSDEESTYLQELRLSSRGKLLDHWPNGFFEEGFKERFE
jgi:AAA15 family ATPase/GTPase